jgi:amino acid permease
MKSNIYLSKSVLKMTLKESKHVEVLKESTEKSVLFKWILNIVRCTHMYIHTLTGFRKHEPSFRAEKQSKDVAQLGYSEKCTLLIRFITFISNVLDSALQFLSYFIPFQ